MQTAAGGEEEFLGAEKERVQREGKLRRGQLVLLEAAKTEAAKLIAQEQFEVAVRVGARADACLCPMRGGPCPDLAFAATGLACHLALLFLTGLTVALPCQPPATTSTRGAAPGHGGVWGQFAGLGADSIHPRTGVHWCEAPPPARHRAA